jgi:hypothetical protein
VGGQNKPQRPGDSPTARGAARPQPTFTPIEENPPQQDYGQQRNQPPRPDYERQQEYQRQLDYQRQREYERQQPYESQTQQYQPAYQNDQQYKGQPPARARQPRRTRRRRRWPVVTAVVVIVLLVLAVVADRFACYEAENQMADRIHEQGLPVKPHVDIEGFPFLTQLLAKDFNDVVITASNVTEGSLTIKSINATLHGMHLIDGYNGARIDTLNGSALITYQALANAGGFPSGITLGPGANSSQIKATVSLPILGSTSATVQISRVGTNTFNVRVIDAAGIESSLLGNLANYTYTVPELPAGMSIQSVSATAQGVVITITGHNTTLTQSSS